MAKFRSYSELQTYITFEDRFEYLKMHGEVGRSTFGFDRYINQKFYASHQWKSIRNEVIMRDNGCDLGVSGYELNGSVLIHHMNPMTMDDLIHANDAILMPEYLITTTQITHNAIHYGDIRLLPKIVMARASNDTKLW
ncbi:MAG: hypothetical protein ABWY25_12390 [Paenisporosarcina sp.]